MSIKIRIARIRSCTVTLLCCMAGLSSTRLAAQEIPDGRHNNLRTFAGWTSIHLSRLFWVDTCHSSGRFYVDSVCSTQTYSMSAAGDNREIFLSLTKGGL
ncbi:hypothetical protein KCP71_08715 [Salmonella enterica subsp. enterica]|nr:hypothetical protein KCP71_08715 [Salmonella enterica subsp. enterica]